MKINRLSKPRLFETLNEFNKTKISANSNNTKYILDGIIHTGKPDVLWEDLSLIQENNSIHTHGSDKWGKKICNCANFIKIFENDYLLLEDVPETRNNIYIIYYDEELTDTDSEMYVGAGILQKLIMRTANWGKEEAWQAAHIIINNQDKYPIMDVADNLINNALPLLSSYDVNTTSINKKWYRNNQFIIFPKLDFSKVTNVSQAFQGVTSNSGTGCKMDFVPYMDFPSCNSLGTTSSGIFWYDGFAYCGGFGSSKSGTINNFSTANSTILNPMKMNFPNATMITGTFRQTNVIEPCTLNIANKYVGLTDFLVSGRTDGEALSLIKYDDDSINRNRYNETYSYYDTFIKSMLSGSIDLMNMNSEVYFKNWSMSVLGEDVTFENESYLFSMRKIGYVVFYDVNRLTNLNVRVEEQGLNPSSYSNISSFCFSFCDNLEKVYIELGDSTQHFSLDLYFYGLESLKTFKIKRLGDKPICSVDGFLQDCPNLRRIDLTDFEITSFTDDFNSNIDLSSTEMLTKTSIRQLKNIVRSGDVLPKRLREGDNRFKIILSTKNLNDIATDDVLFREMKRWCQLTGVMITDTLNSDILITD